MGDPQFIRTPSGEELVVLTRADYDALLEALAEAEEDAADLAVYDARKAELAVPDDILPAPVSAALLRGARLLVALRDWRGMTQMRLAEATGLAQGYLSDLERGRRQGTTETLTRIAMALDVPAKWLVG
ncbi:helix-turn-helix domain-containing protein [Pinisolibacter sp.]|uniref:helix-turn-helix domain-containing protein n=1 Tax=Pinisolibacter sp. TaxID=2172024 RepID=UPI002FDD5D7D